MKISASGTQTWLVQYGGTGFDDCNSVALAPGSGNIVTAGHKGVNLFASFRQNSNGAEVWSYDYDPVVDDIQVAVDSSNNVLLAGSTTDASFGGLARSGNKDVFVVKLNSAGVHQWTQLIGGHGTDYSTLRSVGLTSGNIVALFQSTSTEYEPWGGDGQVLIHLDSAGAEIAHFRDYPELPPGAFCDLRLIFQSSNAQGQYSNFEPHDFVFDSNGDIWVTGWVKGNWPGVSSLGDMDAYLNKVLRFMIHDPTWDEDGILHISYNILCTYISDLSLRACSF